MPNPAGLIINALGVRLLMRSDYTSIFGKRMGLFSPNGYPESRSKDLLMFCMGGFRQPDLTRLQAGLFRHNAKRLV